MTTQLASFDFITSTRVHCGVKAGEKIGETCVAYGKRVLVVADRSIPAAEAVAKAQLTAVGIPFRTVHLESPEPTVTYIDQLSAELRKDQFDCILAVGGGSAVDLAKSLSISLSHTESIWLYANLAYRPPLPLQRATIPVIAVPTTSGTGAEMTPYAVLTNEELKQKGTIQERAIMPKVALLDPELCWTMPPELTAATGLDAFAHALEATINVSKHAPVAEWAGRESMRLIFNALPRAFANPQDLEARQQMAWAAAVAGIAITHRGTTTCHAIAETMGGICHLPHGKSVAITTLPVLKKTLQLRPEIFSSLYGVIQSHSTVDKSAEYCAQAFVESVAQLTQTVGMKRNARSFLPSGAAQGLAKQVLEAMLGYKYRPLKQHPIEFTKEQLSEIIEEVVNG